MALHRDIFWIGRQWAVTGHGMQLIDQRLEGAFDIEVIRLWDDDLIASLRAKAWLKAEDFDKGLAPENIQRLDSISDLDHQQRLAGGGLSTPDRPCRT